MVLRNFSQNNIFTSLSISESQLIAPLNYKVAGYENSANFRSYYTGYPYF